MNLKIRNLLVSDFTGNETYERIIRLAAGAGVRLIPLSAGMVLQDHEITLTCLHPALSFHSEDVNDYSAVLELRFGTFSALFTGDLREEGESLLLQQSEMGAAPSLDFDYDLLKVAHHGSRYSSCTEFLDRISPQWAVISAGVHNQYGHPHAETMERLERVRAETFVTAECGEIRFFVDRSGTVMIRTFL